MRRRVLHVPTNWEKSNIVVGRAAPLFGKNDYDYVYPDVANVTQPGRMDRTAVKIRFRLYDLQQKVSNPNEFAVYDSIGWDYWHISNGSNLIIAFGSSAHAPQNKISSILTYLWSEQASSDDCYTLWIKGDYNVIHAHKGTMINPVEDLGRYTQEADEIVTRKKDVILRKRITSNVPIFQAVYIREAPKQFVKSTASAWHKNGYVPKGMFYDKSLSIVPRYPNLEFTTDSNKSRQFVSRGEYGIHDVNSVYKNRFGGYQRKVLFCHPKNWSIRAENADIYMWENAYSDEPPLYSKKR